jgi:replicative superfamily II helicase
VKGVAFHTGFFTRKTKEHIQEAFSHGDIRILVTTSTLAQSHFLRSVPIVVIDDLKYFHWNDKTQHQNQSIDEEITWMEANQLRRLASKQLIFTNHDDMTLTTKYLTEPVQSQLSNDFEQHLLEFGNLFPTDKFEEFRKRIEEWNPHIPHDVVIQQFENAQKNINEANISKDMGIAIAVSRLPFVELRYLQSMTNCFLKYPKARENDGILLFWCFPEYFSFNSAEFANCPLDARRKLEKKSAVGVLQQMMKGVTIQTIAQHMNIPEGRIEDIWTSAIKRAQQISNYFDALNLPERINYRNISECLRYCVIQAQLPFLDLPTLKKHPELIKLLWEHGIKRVSNIVNLTIENLVTKLTGISKARRNPCYCWYSHQSLLLLLLFSPIHVVGIVVLINARCRYCSHQSLLLF